MSPLDLLPGELNSATAFGLILAAGVAFTLLALAAALAQPDPMTARARAYERRRREGRHARSPAAEPRTAPLDMVKAVLARFNLSRGASADDVYDRLVRAGIRSRDAAAVFLALQLGAPLLFAGLAFVGQPLLLGEPSGLGRLMGPVLCGAVGGLLPSFALRQMTARRQDRLRRGLPDALDLLVICAEAGLSLDAALTRVGRELAPTWPALADELTLTAREIGFLPNRRDALHNLTRRTDLASIRGVVNTLAQTERYGTPLAQSLRVLAAEFRDDRMMRAEEKAAKLPAILTVPLILFIMPALFIVLLGPAMIEVIRTFNS
ncbi:MAG TPA: type II secretion system F family protein [Alphaproteobacteria bacterium]|nr:type II secretion system F family protein [Alphaproteobacteria bacterium]